MVFVESFVLCTKFMELFLNSRYYFQLLKTLHAIDIRLLHLLYVFNSDRPIAQKGHGLQRYNLTSSERI